MGTPNEGLPQAEKAAAAPPAGLLDKIVLQGRMVKDVTQQSYARELVEEFASQITGGGLMTVGTESVQVLPDSMTIGPDTVTSIKSRIAQIDEAISVQLNQIMHDPAFQDLEAAWRGLNYLVMNSETGTHLKIRLLNITKKELLNDMEKATEFDQSVMFKKVYEEEYGTFGGIDTAF